MQTPRIKLASGTLLHDQPLRPKLPPFNLLDCQLWLHMVENEFLLSHITSNKEKFLYLQSELPPEIASWARNIIMSSVTENSYGMLCSALITISKDENMRPLLENEKLGCSMPTEYLQRLIDIDPHITYESHVLRDIFIKKMPMSIQKELIKQEKITPLNELAKLANKRYHSSQNTEDDKDISIKLIHIESNIDRVYMYLRAISDTLDNLHLKGHSQSQEFCFYNAESYHQCDIP